MHRSVEEHFRSPEGFFEFALRGPLTESAESFGFGSDTLLYGRRWTGASAAQGPSRRYDASVDVRCDGMECSLPFDPTEVAENFRRERYLPPRSNQGARRGFVRNAYYFIRPLLPVSLRKHAQRLALRGWDRQPFPSWPVDRTVDRLFEKLMLIALNARGLESAPFIWFWPEGKAGCALMTHDVETQTGLRFCDELMDLNESFGIRASFQLIPTGRYEVPPATVGGIRKRGFEVNVHDWNHDGSLFLDYDVFQARAAKISQCAARWQARGFRSAVLYRNCEWLEKLDFSYDMSVPSVGHLEPQPGGCCTLFPYFIGDVLEIPVTTTQDYSLFYILNQYSTDLWRRQIGAILDGNGLASFIVHPDYIREQRARATYTQLLEYLARMRSDRDVWIALPGDVDLWWRQRSQMRLVRQGERWMIEGEGQERARIAYAQIQDDQLVYTIGSPAASLVA